MERTTLIVSTPAVTSLPATARNIIATSATTVTTRPRRTTRMTTAAPTNASPSASSCQQPNSSRSLQRRSRLNASLHLCSNMSGKSVLSSPPLVSHSSSRPAVAASAAARLASHGHGHGHAAAAASAAASSGVRVGEGAAVELAQRMARCAPVLEDGLLNNLATWLYDRMGVEKWGGGGGDVFELLPAIIHDALHSSETALLISFREVLLVAIVLLFCASLPAICRAANWLWGKVVMRDGDICHEEFEDSAFHALIGPLQFFAIALILTRHMRMLLPLVRLQLRPVLVRFVRTVTLVIATVWFAEGWKERAMKLLMRSKPDEKPVLLHVSSFLTLFFRLAGVISVLELLHVNLRSLLAFGGVSGVAIGFAAKEIFTNFFGGLVLFATQPFVVGNSIKAGSFGGKVLEIGYLQTKLEGFDRNPIVVPNQMFLSAVITNYSRSRCRLLDATFDLRNQDIVHVRRITNKITTFLRSHPSLLKEGATPPVAYLKALTASCMQVAVTVTLKPMPKALFLEVQQDILERCAEIIVAEGAFFGSNAPFRPSLPLSSSLMSGSPSDGEMSDGRVGGMRVSETMGA